MSENMYLYTAMGAILGAMGITIDVYLGEQPGEVIISISGLPPEVDRETVVRMLNKPDVRPLTDIVTVKFNK
jgi:phage-related baseplate assembly protein